MQTLLLMSALVVFSFASLNFNNTITDHQSFHLGAETSLTGIAIADEILTEISSRAFDENSVNASASLGPSDFTLASRLGIETGETAYDDVDDYHGLSYYYNSERIDSFEVSIRVSYADTTNPMQTSLTPTTLKRIELVLKNPILIADSLEFTSYRSYF